MPAKKKDPVSSKILWVEGRWSNNSRFVSILRKKGFDLETVSTGKAALEKAKKGGYDLMVVNAASMRTNGKRICKSLRDEKPSLPIMLICDPEKAADKKNTDVNTLLVLPFTSRKLVNRIEPLLPGDESRMIKLGPILLDANRSQVKCHGKKTTLTPRLIRLLKILMDKNGQVVEREALFKEVWRTNYTGDTRTLDVHISWLRRAIEKDPRNPKLLNTIRGVGYRLDA